MSWRRATCEAAGASKCTPVRLLGDGRVADEEAHADPRLTRVSLGGWTAGKRTSQEREVAAQLQGTLVDDLSRPELERQLSESSMGDMHLPETRKLLVDLIMALNGANSRRRCAHRPEQSSRRLVCLVWSCLDLGSWIAASFPDFDFSALRPDAFVKQPSVQVVIGIINKHLLEVAPMQGMDMATEIWSTVDRELELSNSEVYKFVSDDETDPAFSPGIMCVGSRVHVALGSFF